MADWDVAWFGWNVDNLMFGVVRLHCSSLDLDSYQFSLHCRYNLLPGLSFYLLDNWAECFSQSIMKWENQRVWSHNLEIKLGFTPVWENCVLIEVISRYCTSHSRRGESRHSWFVPSHLRGSIIIGEKVVHWLQSYQRVSLTVTQTGPEYRLLLSTYYCPPPPSSSPHSPDQEVLPDTDLVIMANFAFLWESLCLCLYLRR